MNSYFATIGKKLAEELQLTSKSSRPYNLNTAKTTTEPPPLEELTISQYSIHTKVNALNINKSTGPDNISSKLLRIAGNAIVPALTGLYQYSCESKINRYFQRGRSQGLHRSTKKMMKLNEEITAQSPYSAFQARSWSR